MYLLCLCLVFLEGCAGASVKATNDNASSDAISKCATKDDAPIRHFDVTIPPMEVPGDSLTTYICQVVKVPVPTDRDYHAVGFLPLITNHDVMHHMILFSCDGSNDIPSEMTEPHRCGRLDNSCRSWIAQWSMGVKGVMCPFKETGVRFGKSVGTHLLLQIHWNNAQLTPSLIDHSGIRVYYTEHLRPFDLGHVQIGQHDPVIPPGVTRHAQSGGCSGECTRILFPHPIHITTAHLHMHYLGAGGRLEVIHKDGSITQVTHDDTYEYTHPPVHHLDIPVTVNPGDYLRLTCLFSSREGEQKRNRTIFFGEGSDGEMCYAFLAYYPKIRGFDQCLQIGSHDINCPSKSNDEYLECTGNFLSVLTSQYIPDMTSACNKSDVDLLCHDGCKQSLQTLGSHPCLKGHLGNYLERQFLPGLSGWDYVTKTRSHFASMCGTSSIM